MHWWGAWIHRQFLRSLLTRKPAGADSNLDKTQRPNRAGAWYNLDTGSPTHRPRVRKRCMMVENTWNIASHT